jgi:predicted dienelactone hydrolase
MYCLRPGVPRPPPWGRFKIVVKGVVMSHKTQLSAALLTALACTRVHAADLYKPDAGPNEVATVKLEWKDDKRIRPVPVLIYAPKDGKGPFPVIIFSHGLGGTREGYAYLGKHWAGHGYVCVHLQHIGSDDAVWRGKDDPAAELKKAVQDGADAYNRPLDVRFALDQLQKMNKDDEKFKGRLDLDRVGMAGHSFGAWTTLAVAGEVLGNPGEGQYTISDQRVKAAVAMSASPPRDKNQYAKAYGDIQIPCLHMTGTLDDSPVGNGKAADRRVPFDHMTKADQYLVTFEGGDHMIFSDAAGNRAFTKLIGKQPGTGGDRAKDERFQEYIKSISTAFWDACLKDDAKAKAWLTDGSCQEALGKEAAFEQKAGEKK